MSIRNRSKTKKAYFNVISSGALEVVAFVCSLILPRMILRSFGSEANGLVSSITQFLSFISILTIGVAGPTRVAFYKTLTSDDLRGTSAIVKATSRFYRKIGLAFLAYTICIGVALPFIIRTNFKWLEVFLLVIIIGIGTLAEYCFGATYENLVKADQSVYIYTIIRIFSRILITLTAILLMKQGFNLFIVKLSTAMINAAAPLILYLYVHKKYKLVKDVEPDNSALKQRKHAAATSIANIVHDKTDIVVLTVFTNALTVSVYSVYMIVMNGLTSIMKVFTNSLEAPFGTLWAKGEIEGVKKNLRIYEYFVYSFVCIVFSTCGLLVMPFVQLYTKVVDDVNYAVPAFAILSTLATAVFCIRQPFLTLVQAAGKYKETKVGSIIEAAINIGLSILFVIWFGVVGVTVGTLAANLFRTIQYGVYISKHMIDRPITVFLRRLLWTIVNSCIIICICVFVPGILRYDSWTSWILSGVFCVLIGLFVTTVSSLLFYRQDLRSLLKVFKRMVK